VSNATAVLRARLLWLALSVLLLAACGHTPVTQTLFDAIPGLGNSLDTIDDSQLNPNLRYLRVVVRGRTALMVLGYLEPHEEGAIEIWYSAPGEYIRLQNGRVVGTAGLETDWRTVRHFSLPTWKDMTGRTAVVYRRERDEMPGYRYGIAENVSVYPVRVPNNAKLKRLPAEGLQWYEEAVLGASNGLPSGRFALSTQNAELRVIYGEQCLSREFCFAWQTWPPKQ